MTQELPGLTFIPDVSGDAVSVPRVAEGVESCHHGQPMRRPVIVLVHTGSLGTTTEGASMPRRFLVERAGDSFDLVDVKTGPQN